MKRSDFLRYKRAQEGRKRSAWRYLAWAAGIVLLLALIYRLPPVYSRLSWRVDELRTRIIYAINPPDEAAFGSGADSNELETIVQATLQALTVTPAPTGTATQQIDATPTGPTPTPTITPMPLPEIVILDGVTYVDQHNRWNYCGPANLTMALNFWGWTGNRDDVAAIIKPGENNPDLDFIQRGKSDKNVMPYEMANFVVDQTDFNVVTRSGGDIELVKRMVASGFPVVIEKGYYEADYTGKIAWLGHYLFVTGYDESKGIFIVQDAYLKPGKDMESEYETFIEGWRSFNYLFMVIYPPEDEATVFELLGPWADPAWADRHALEISIQEGSQLGGIDQFFAWFNKGTAHVALQEYGDAAFAYDYAFLLYDNLEDNDNQRPYRIMWYQTGPYWAYYYSGQYQRVIDLANTTLLETVSDPTLEESIYWRGMGYNAIGQTGNAIADFQETVYLNPNFSPGWSMLAQLGVTP